MLDEPSEGLDLKGRQLIRDVMARQQKSGRTVLFVSHLLNEVEQLCNRVAVIVEEVGLHRAGIVSGSAAEHGGARLEGRVEDSRRDAGRMRPNNGELKKELRRGLRRGLRKAGLSLVVNCLANCGQRFGTLSEAVRPWIDVRQIWNKLRAAIRNVDSLTSLEQLDP